MYNKLFDIESIYIYDFRPKNICKMSFDVYCIEILVLIMIIKIRTIIKFMKGE